MAATRRAGAWTCLGDSVAPTGPWLVCDGTWHLLMGDEWTGCGVRPAEVVMVEPGDPWYRPLCPHCMREAERGGPP